MSKQPAAPAPVADQGEQAPTRHRNRRGEGPRLREEIVRAATTLIVRSGSDQAVTLRSVAREVGIAAPSIYAHFADRDAIVDAVVVESLTQLRESVLGASGGYQDPVEALLAGCAAYVEFGTREPARYRLLFDSPRAKQKESPCDPDGFAAVGAPAAEGAVGADAASPGASHGLLAFQTLVEGLEACARAGRSAGDDPFGDAVALWTALHGQVTLRAGLPNFPWPHTDTVEQLVRRLGRITPAA
ncbi:TetR/AcrR family transcriptional regulator [Kitasatospora sp. NBC_00240]|uniref:TetR/AcrR family transcriptional regulator n=1 Tax=Kitasatospora sp. NBC_00240 TaxID=2903567 RepID=UPI00225431AF|nr:TetR/AcrR family transcriptional regulator [Kitasatospora sp. NBC_00240]MCX5214258.1 TetR/AcrR family transcriptional regulator [Kitasatospora sp. NBC_00240]